MEISFLLQFLDVIFLQDFFNFTERGQLGSDDPIIKGLIPSMFAMTGFGILLNLFNSGVRRKLVDQVKPYIIEHP